MKRARLFRFSQGGERTVNSKSETGLLRCAQNDDVTQNRANNRSKFLLRFSMLGGWVGAVYEVSGANADGARGFVDLPEGEGTADRDAYPDNDEDGGCVFRGETVPEVNDVSAVTDAEPCCDDVTQASTDGEGDHEFFSRHLECARCEDEGAERHGRRKDGGQGDGEDGVGFHPLADALEGARGNTFLEEGHAAALADQMAEVSPDRGAGSGEQNQQDDVLMLRGHDDDHDVGDAGHGQWDEGAVDDGDQKDAEESEAEKEMEERAAWPTMSCRGLRGSLCEVLRRAEGRREKLHT